MTDEKGDMGQIVEVDFAPRAPTEDDLDPLLRVKRVFDYPLEACRHDGTRIIDEKLRRVTCKACGEQLDPMQALIEIADKWERYGRQLAAMRHELDRRTKSIEELRREEQNIKARLRRARGSDGA